MGDSSGTLKKGLSLTRGHFSNCKLAKTSGKFQINLFGMLQIRDKTLNLFDPVTVAGQVCQNELQQAMDYLVVFRFLKDLFSRIIVCQRQEFPAVKISRWDQ